MAKRDIHPDYHTIIIKTTDGGQFETRSCFGKEGSIITVELDPFNHPAWKNDGGQVLNTNDNRIVKFNKKWGFK